MEIQVRDSIRGGLYKDLGIVNSYLIDTDNPRIDSYQCIKMLRVVMVQLYDISERLKKIEDIKAVSIEEKEMLK